MGWSGGDDVGRGAARWYVDGGLSGVDVVAQVGLEAGWRWARVLMAR